MRPRRVVVPAFCSLVRRVHPCIAVGRLTAREAASAMASLVMIGLDAAITRSAVIAHTLLRCSAFRVKRANGCAGSGHGGQYRRLPSASTIASST